jgi:hypothetical protein
MWVDTISLPRLEGRINSKVNKSDVAYSDTKSILLDFMFYLMQHSSF